MVLAGHSKFLLVIPKTGRVHGAVLALEILLDTPLGGCRCQSPLNKVQSKSDTPKGAHIFREVNFWESPQQAGVQGVPSVRDAHLGHIFFEK